MLTRTRTYVHTHTLLCMCACVLACAQVRFLTIRSLRCQRFAAFSLQRVLELLVVAILAGVFWFQRGNNGSAPITAEIALDMSGVLFFMVRKQNQATSLTRCHSSS